MPFNLPDGVTNSDLPGYKDDEYDPEFLKRYYGLKKIKTYWYEFHEWYCPICASIEIHKHRVYNKPKPLNWENRHHEYEEWCGCGAL